MSSRRSRELHSNLSATRNLLSEAVRHLDAASSTETVAPSHGSSRVLTTPNRAPNELPQSANRSLPNGLSNVQVQRETECSRPTSISYPYRPFNSRGLSLKRYNEGSFRGRSKKKKVAMWEKEFTCLAHIDQKRTPDPLHKAELIRAGLGGARLSLFENGDAWEFHEQLVEKFPKLHDGGGYELLRTVGSSHELQIIPPPSGGYTTLYVKSVVGQAKVYVRPLQKDLSLEEVGTESDVVSETKCRNVCLKGIVNIGFCSWSVMHGVW